MTMVKIPLLPKEGLKMSDASKSKSQAKTSRVVIALQKFIIRAMITCLGLTVPMLFGGVVGLVRAEKTLMHQAAERGYAEYCSAIGDLVWKGECRKEIE